MPSLQADESPIIPRYLTLAQAGVYCGNRSVDAMRMMCRRGRIPVIKHGKSIFIDRLEIDKVMAASTITLI